MGKYNLYPEDDMKQFSDLMLMVEAVDDTNDAPDDQAKSTEDEVFDTVKDTPDYPEQTNASIFLGHLDSGEFSAVSNTTSPNDPAVRGIGAVITGDILSNGDSIINYIDPLFEKTGLNDIDPEDFKNIKSAVWKKLEELTGRDPITAYGQFEKYAVSLVNELRANKQLKKVDTKIDEKPSDELAGIATSEPTDMPT